MYYVHSWANALKHLDEMNDFVRKDKLRKWAQEKAQNPNTSIPVTETFRVVQDLHSRKTRCSERF